MLDVVVVVVNVVVPFRTYVRLRNRPVPSDCWRFMAASNIRQPAPSSYEIVYPIPIATEKRVTVFVPSECETVTVSTKPLLL